MGIDQRLDTHFIIVLYSRRSVNYLIIKSLIPGGLAWKHIEYVIHQPTNCGYVHPYATIVQVTVKENARMEQPLVVPGTP
jgi:hypothetical protein